jgi:hypothetical protein
MNDDRKRSKPIFDNLKFQFSNAENWEGVNLIRLMGKIEASPDLCTASLLIVSDLRWIY